MNEYHATSRWPAAWLALLAWAGRDLWRRPGETLLLAAAVAVLCAWLGVALLLPRAMAVAADRTLAAGPALVVRRVAAGGWQPLPEAEALAAASRVAGALNPRGRVWGLATGPRGPLTVFAAASAVPLSGGGTWRPAPGEALVGEAVGAQAGERLSLSAERSLSLRVAGTFDPRGALAGYDLVALHPEEARWLLGLSADMVTDLAVDVFHPIEAEALAPDLGRAFPWPVNVLTRPAAAGAAIAGGVLRSGLAVTIAVPAVLALVLLTLHGARSQRARRIEIGLLKALGWSSAQVVRLHLLGAALRLLPAAALGLAVAHRLVFAPGLRWPGRLWLAWQREAVPLWLDPGGGLPLLALAGVLVLLPCFAAVLLPLLMAVRADPQELLESGGLP